MTSFLPPGLPPELLLVLPLAMAAGIDLYLTLLFVGAATTTAWWTSPLPGALGDLDSLGVLVLVGGFYVLEFAAERGETSGLVWNAFHSIIRPVAGALLAMLLLDGQPLGVIAGGAIVSGAVASWAHAIRSGRPILRWLTGRSDAHPLLQSLAEDAIVLGLVALVLDLPLWALAAASGLAAVGAWRGRSDIRAFVFGIQLVVRRVFRSLEGRRWTETDDFPKWVRSALADDPMAPGGGLRGSPAAAYRLASAPTFATGWVVVRGDSPVFVYRQRRRPVLVELDGVVGTGVVESGFFRRLELNDDASAGVFFGVDGPSAESLRAEFMFE